MQTLLLGHLYAQSLTKTKDLSSFKEHRSAIDIILLFAVIFFSCARRDSHFANCFLPYKQYLVIISFYLEQVLYLPNARIFLYCTVEYDLVCIVTSLNTCFCVRIITWSHCTTELHLWHKIKWVVLMIVSRSWLSLALFFVLF